MLNGAYTTYGATYTSGGMLAQTAGTPIHTFYLSSNVVNGGSFAGYLLPGAVTLGDLLENEGYHQVLMIGSEGEFGGRSAYFTGHGNYEIIDYNTAIEEGWIPEDYKVWWGYEDAKLISFAKEKLLALAAEEEPFNFTVLTVDTHPTDGYFCGECEDEYDVQYNNVIACASRQICELVSWIMEQDFYENTTIVICGDHLTMDSDYITKMDIGDYARRTYVAVINPADGCEEPGYARTYTTLDLYPTTLAALGVSIEGNRLGLGVNLFSDELTLYEEYGEEYINEQLLKASEFYENELMK